ncbi:cupin domain-containing protein [Calothrix sp. 336/3]|uniref:cupin domain-containing protein n=1 Tax=Calothrix sp. 336/3 TaxID=1337936 RepID=UPI0004E3B350|nr:cupin domain-containing protein [Calothrix sp. 336/3]
MTSTQAFTTQLHEQANYNKSGVQRQVLVKNDQAQFSLVCLTAGTSIPEHSTPRNVSVTIIEGSGSLTLAGQEIALQPGVFVYIPAKAPHSLRALENLAFLHT